MEKQRISTKYRLLKRLLILVFFLFSHYSLFSEPSKPSRNFENLLITPEENQTLITDKDIKYSVTIPNVNPMDVEVSVTELQDNTQFKTLRRTRFKGTDTKLELWYEFQNQGNNTPSPLKLSILGEEYTLYFASSYIAENIMTAKPVLVFSFSNGVSVSEKNDSALFQAPASKEIYFNVSVKNAKEIISADYKLPKNELLVINQKNNSKSNKNSIYWADFSWTPLVKGRTYLPEINMKVQGNDGTIYSLSTPEAFITVTKKTSVQKTDNNNSLFSDSFSYLHDNAENIDDSSSTSERLLLEKISVRKNKILKFSIFFFIFLIAAIIILLVLKIKSPFPYMLITFIALIFLIFYGALSKKKTAVYTDGTIKSIPEESGGTLIQITEFSEVKILKETKDWYCIQGTSATGWTKKENVRFY